MDDYLEKLIRSYLKDLLEIDSTSGFYEEISDYLKGKCTSMGFAYTELSKGGILVNLGGNDNKLVIMVHCDDVGLMVRRIKSNGSLMVLPIGGLPIQGALDANVKVHTLDGKVFYGTIRKEYSCVHAIPTARVSESLDYESNIEIVLDEDVSDAQQTTALGISVGDIVSLESGYTEYNRFIKSRHLDDKSGVAIVLALMDKLSSCKLQLKRNVVIYFTMYEEVGHGGSWIPDNTKDVIAVDITTVSPQHYANEKKVTILAKDNKYPYHRGLVKELIETAQANNIDFVIDTFSPRGATDASFPLAAGHDIRHAAIGPGVMGSHSYERTHYDGLKNTYNLIYSYIIDAKDDNNFYIKHA